MKIYSGNDIMRFCYQGNKAEKLDLMYKIGKMKFIELEQLKSWIEWNSYFSQKNTVINVFDLYDELEVKMEKKKRKGKIHGDPLVEIEE